MENEIVLMAEYEVRTVYENYILLLNDGSKYKVFKIDSKIKILKEIEDLIYRELSDKETQKIIKSIKDGIEESEVKDMVYTSKPLRSKASTIFTEDKEIKIAKQLVKNVES